MPNTAATKLLMAARESLANPIGFSDFLEKLPQKDRANAERRISVLDTEPDRSRLWQRLACSLMTLAPHAAKLVGKQTLQIYVADGKFRMQVFALEDLQDGNFTIYCPDVLDEAVKAGLLAHPAQVESDVYEIAASKEPLRIARLDKHSISPGAHFKDLVGWNRKALRVTVPASPSAAQIEAAELLCAIAAQGFDRATPPSARPSAQV
jgi:hypothetical protein